MPAGHKVSFGKPPQGNIDYAAFVKTKLRAIAAGVGVTYEQISGDLEGVSFSSIRSGLIEFRREMTQIQTNVLIFQMCRPAWRRWFETAVLAGRIKIPDEERSNLPKLLRAAWQPPGWEYVEPEKDIRTAVRKIRAGLSSRTIEAAKLGIDVEELDIQIAADKKRSDALGLTFDSDPDSDSDGAARASALTEPAVVAGGEATSGGDTGTAGDGGDAGEPGEAAA
jgi:lambda family phage portal protein